METKQLQVPEAQKIQETDQKMDPDLSITQGNAPETMKLKPEESEEKSNATTEPSKVQEVEKIKDDRAPETLDDKTLKTEESEESDQVQEGEEIKEIDQKMDPDDHAREESEEKPNATRVSALDMIHKSLSQISLFTKELANFHETQHMVTEDETVVQPLQQLRDFLVSNLSLTHPMEANSVCDMLVTIMELVRNLGSVPLSCHFEVSEAANKICNRCKMNMEYPVERSYGLLMDANSIREIKDAFKDFTFENILKVIRMNLKMPCDKLGCGKRNYVQQTINKLPSVFTVALEWENNETDSEIILTTSFLATEIDISAIYLYEGPCQNTRYCLVSMVCLHGDEYNCVAYENNKWVRHFSSEKEVIGDWGSVVNIFARRKIRPEILFFENVQGRD